MRKFDELSEREILALAISNEEEDARIFADFADGLHDDYPASAKVFDEMAAEENGHRRRLIDLFVAKFGDHIPAGAAPGHPGLYPGRSRSGICGLWASTRCERMRARWSAPRRASIGKRLTRATDASTRKLLGDLAEEEEKHDQIAAGLEEQILTTSARGAEAENERRRFVLQIIQPGLVGLMDGSVSTLAPVFAAAFATHNSWNAFLVGLAASIGAGISMGFAEALSDDGKLSGRGAPLLRGLVCGLMTTAGASATPCPS